MFGLNGSWGTLWYIYLMDGDFKNCINSLHSHFNPDAMQSSIMKILNSLLLLINICFFHILTGLDGKYYG